MGVEYQIQLKSEIPIESRNMNFLPLYEIPNKMMHELVLGYQLKTNQLKRDSH